MGLHPRPPRTLRSLAPRILVALALPLLLLLGFAPSASAQSAPPDPIGKKIIGTLLNAGEPLVDVKVTIVQGDKEIGSAKSDATGRFSIDVPAPGDYDAVIDPKTLPKGVELRSDKGDRVSVKVLDNTSFRAALFKFGEGRSGPASRLDRAPQLVIGGLQFGLVLAMASIGLSLIFGTTGLTNFAHGELVTGGALLGYVFNVKLGLNLIPATMIAVIVGGVVGYLLDKGLWGPLRRRGTGLIAGLVVSIGLSFVLRYIFLIYYGGSSRSYDQYSTQRPITFWKVGILPRDMVIVVITLVVLLLVGLALGRTRFGKATRAVADNPTLAATSGINVERVISLVWAIGTALAVLGGVFLALSQQVGYQLGQNILLLLFAAVTLGGLGTAYGALVGAVVIGLFTQLSTLFIPAELQVVGALIVLIVVLVVRPQGILGSRERVG